MNYLNLLANSNSVINHKWAIIYIVLGVIAFIVGIVVTLFFIKFYKKRKFEVTNSFKINTSRKKIMSFWTNYAVVFCFITCFLLGILFVVIGIGVL